MRRAKAAAGNEQAPPLTVNALSQEERRCLARMATLVTRELGIRMPPSKLGMLQGRVLRRMRALSLASVTDYEAYLQGPRKADELRQFFDAVTTNKTDFFREPQHFSYLTRTALPSLKRHLGAGPRWLCRVWCAGCSSGQEAYTLAMVLAEYADAHPQFSFSIHATDVSTRMLDEGALGIYEEALIAGVPPALKARFILRSKDRARPLVRIAPELRARVTFSHLNFMQERYPLRGPFDVIFFRNVMIYFDKATQQQVVERQCRLLRPHGYLFTSHTETLAGLELPLRSVADAVYARTP